MAASGSPVSPRLESPRVEINGRVVQAHTLLGDRLMAGPVLLDHRAVWAEAGRRLLIRSLDAHGHTRTIFSTSKTPGAPKGTLWPFDVPSIAAGSGMVAFVEQVTTCASAPPSLRRCAPFPGEEVLPYSVTLFAGRPGAIRPVESAAHPGCSWRSATPEAVEVARAGLVVKEMASPCGAHPPTLRLVLRSFSGSLLRALARGQSVEMPTVVAGRWAAFLERPAVGLWPDRLRIVGLSTGKTVLQLWRRCWLGSTEGIALDSSGEFALMNDSDGSWQSSCQRPQGNIVRVGQIGSSRMRILATHVAEASSLIAISDGLVTYASQNTQVMIAAPGAAPATIPGMKFGPLAFDGAVVATAHEDTVQLAALRRR